MVEPLGAPFTQDSLIWMALYPSEIMWLSGQSHDDKTMGHMINDKKARLIRFMLNDIYFAFANVSMKHEVFKEKGYGMVWCPILFKHLIISNVSINGDVAKCISNLCLCQLGFLFSSFVRKPSDTPVASTLPLLHHLDLVNTGNNR